MQCKCCHQMMNEAVSAIQLHIDSFMEIIHYTATTVHAVGIKEADSVVSSCLCPQHSMNLGLSALWFTTLAFLATVFTAAQWLRLWVHSKSSVAFLWGIYMFTMCLCGFSPGDSFFPQSWDVHVMLHSNSKLALGVNMTTNDCTSLCASP